MNLQSFKGTPDRLKWRFKGSVRKLSVVAPADWLVAIVYRSTDNRNDVRCNARAFSKENKAISARTFSINRRQLSMVNTLIDHKMTP